MMENFFKKRRLAMGKTQFQMARELDFRWQPQSIGQWEREELSPNILEAKVLAPVYGVTVVAMEHEILNLKKRVAAAKQLASSK